MSPRVAVVVPCFDDGDVLPETLASVQEDEPIELVVVDDHSADPATLQTLDRLRAEGVRVVRHDVNKGLSEARMTGVRETSAPYIFPLDSDDLAVSGRLAEMADLLDVAPDAAVCFGDFEEFGTKNFVRPAPKWLDPFRLAYTNEYPVSALFRREALLEVGGWPTMRYGYEDWSLWLALAERGLPSVYAGPGVVTYRRRLHGERMLTTAKRHHRELFRRLRQLHPGVYGRIAEHHRISDLSLLRKLLYPIVYGSRPRFSFEPRVKSWLDRLGVWTLRR